MDGQENQGTSPEPSVSPGQSAPTPDGPPPQIEFKRVRVLVETTERSFRGFVYMPADGQRLSDHLNNYRKNFLCMDQVEISDRGKHYATGDSVNFVALALSSITYIRPLDDDA